MLLALPAAAPPRIGIADDPAPELLDDGSFPSLLPPCVLPLPLPLPLPLLFNSLSAAVLLLPTAAAAFSLSSARA